MIPKMRVGDLDEIEMKHFRRLLGYPPLRSFVLLAARLGDYDAAIVHLLEDKPAPALCPKGPEIEMLLFGIRVKRMAKKLKKTELEIVRFLGAGRRDWHQALRKLESFGWQSKVKRAI